MHSCSNLTVWVSLSMKQWTKSLKLHILFHAKSHENCLLTPHTMSLMKSHSFHAIKQIS